MTKTIIHDSRGGVTVLVVAPSRHVLATGQITHDPVKIQKALDSFHDSLRAAALIEEARHG